ncbi:MAG TPA: ribosome-associated translation inhibitor RaiA [Microvirga sp.]|nr:ribosome-associated translation inhibitor RaiA [Microvirga sp.]
MKLRSVDRTILVQSSNIDLGDMLPEYARTSILRVAGKYFGHLNTATVHFTREGITYRCTVNIQMGALRMMSGEAKDKDIYAAFRTALEKVAKQLRRAKRELREDKAERVDKDMLLRREVELRRVAGRLNRRSSESRQVLELDGYRMPVRRAGEGAYRIAAE